MSDRLVAFRADTARSGDALDALVAGWASEPVVSTPAVSGPVRFVGLGSSRFAAIIVAAALSADGRLARVELPQAASPPIEGETVFAVSASGRTPEVVEAARRLAREGADVVAVTNAAGSPLAGAADRCIELRAGVEASGIASLTYRATIAALALATGCLDLDDVRAAAQRLRARNAALAERLREAADLLDGAPRIDVVADASLLGAAEQAALMLREASRLPAVAWDAGEWLHTAIYTALPGHRLVILGRTPYRDELVSVVRGRGGRVVELAGASESVGSIEQALELSVVVEGLAADLWERA